MKRIKFYDKELVDLVEMQALGELVDDFLAYTIKTLLYAGFNVLSGFSLTQTPTPSGSVELSPSLGLIDGALIDIETVQTVNTLGGSGGWGTPKPANEVYARYSIICIKYTTKDTDSTAKWFIDDTDPQNPAEYQNTVTTRISDYYEIITVHGEETDVPSVPAVPDGYTKIAEIYVPEGATTILDTNITMTVPARTYRLDEILSLITDHEHAELYYSKTLSDARYPQKAFSNIKVGGQVALATTKEDLLEIVAGSNVTVGLDTVNKKLTISATGITEHGSLSNLSADDHTQYLNNTRHTAIKGNPHSTSHGDLGELTTTDDHTQYLNTTRHTAVKGNPHSTNHNTLVGLSNDDHTQYLNTTRHIAITGNPHSTHHHELSGLSDDDHAQYLNNSRHSSIAGNPHGTHHHEMGGLGDDDHTQYLNTARHTNIKGNPHSTSHSQLGSIYGVDPASTNTTRDKHIANNDLKSILDWQASQPHITVSVSAPSSPSLNDIWVEKVIL